MSQQEPDLRFHICDILFAFSLLLDVEVVTELCDAAKECYTRCHQPVVVIRELS